MHLIQSPPKKTNLLLRTWQWSVTAVLGLVITSLALTFMLAVILHGWVVPHVDSLRPRLEAYASKEIGQHIQIGRITAQSSHLLPSFELQDVRLLDAQSQTTLQLKRIDISVSPLSLFAAHLDKLVIDAPEMDITRDANNQWTVAGFVLGTKGDSSQGLDWLFSQKEIIVRGGTLHWHDDFVGAADTTFNDISLSIKNGVRHHQFQLSATPPQNWGLPLQLVGKFTQPLLETHAGHWQAWSGGVALQGEQLQVSALAALAKTYTKSISLSGQLNGQINQFKLSLVNGFSPQAKVRLQADLANPDVAGKLDVTWQADGGLIDVQNSFSRIDLSALHRYLPQAVPLNIHQYLEHAIQKGIATDVRLTARGALKDFPFTKPKTGEFLIQGKISDGQFLADPLGIWPRLTAMKAQFDLRGLALTLSDIHTVFAGVPVTGSVRIADLSKPVVEISSEATGPLSSFITLVKVTPIHQIIHQVLTISEGTGQAAVKVNVSLPLSTLNQIKVSGSLQLLGENSRQGNSLTFNALTPPLTNLRGLISFNETGFQLNHIQAAVLGGDLYINGNSQHLTGGGTMTIKGLSSWKSIPALAHLDAYAQGETPYTFSVDLRPKHNSLVIESNLTGLQLNLPAPLKKDAKTSLPFRFEQINWGQQDQPQDQIKASLAGIANVEFVRDTSGPSAKILRGLINIGGLEKTPLPLTGVHANIQLNQFSPSAWTSLFPSGGGSSDFNQFMPTTLNVEINKLELGNRIFEKVKLDATKLKTTWRINMDAKDFNGYAEYRPQKNGQAEELYARLSRLSLPDVHSELQVEQLMQTPTQTIPALDVVVDEFELAGKKLGHVEILALINKAQEWNLKKLNVSNPEATFKATGSWSPRNPTNSARHVSLDFALDIADSGQLLARLGQVGTLKDGKGTLQGHVTWIGSPLALDYPSLTGDLRLNIAKGQFLKIDPGKTGRFLSVLSLQALPRLLTLDFRDIFSDGFAFDNLGGDAQITAGVLTSKNLQMKSVLALVSVDGRVDLAKETQNLHVMVLPDINAGGVSLLTALVNPILGATTYLYGLILSRPAVAAATKEFHIEGSWQDPKVNEIPKK